MSSGLRAIGPRVDSWCRNRSPLGSAGTLPQVPAPIRAELGLAEGALRVIAGAGPAEDLVAAFRAALADL